MKTSLNKIGFAVLSRLAKKLNAKTVFNKITRFNLHVECRENEDVYLWDWEYGLVKIENPKMKLGDAICSALTEEVTESRFETSRFSHICIHNKNKGILFIFRFACGPDESLEWQHEFEFWENNIHVESSHLFHEN